MATHVRTQTFTEDVELDAAFAYARVISPKGMAGDAEFHSRVAAMGYDVELCYARGMWIIQSASKDYHLRLSIRVRELIAIADNGVSFE